MEFYLQGLTIGLAYIAPIGMQNMFVINTALTQPRKKVLLTALIVIFFDISLSVACFYGIGIAMEKFPLLEKIILGIGTVAVLIMGLKLLLSKDTADKSKDVSISLLQVISMSFAVAWLNPQAIIDGTMLLGAFKASIPTEFGNIFILGVATASVIWFIGLSMIISLFSKSYNKKILRGINIVCGLIIMVYGIKLGYSFFIII